MRHLIIAFRLTAAAILLAPAAVPSACAQETADSSQSARHDPFAFRTTLEGWAEGRRRLVLDRRHSIGGRLYDRGVFRHITPKINREYAQEMLVQRFPSEAFGRRRRAEQPAPADRERSARSSCIRGSPAKPGPS